MATHLATFFKRRRLDMGLALGQAAREVGYRNISKGSNRLHRFETTGEIHQELFRKLAVALEVGEDTIKRLIKRDYDEWNKWLNCPIRPYLVLRIMPAIYTRLELPDTVWCSNQAETFAGDVARQYRKRCCLILSRRISIYFAADGTFENVTETIPGEPSQPFMQIKSGKPFLLNMSEPGIATQDVE